MSVKVAKEQQYERQRTGTSEHRHNRIHVTSSTGETQHFVLLVELVYKVATVLTRHKQRQDVDKLSFAQHHDRLRYHTKNHLCPSF